MKRVALWIALLLLPAAVVAQDAEPLARSGIEAYERGLAAEERDTRLAHFRRAEQRFTALTEQGVENADLYANLGNAALLSEQLGVAVLAYRRALRLDPDHPAARQNLEHARGLLPSWVPRGARAGMLDTFFFWHRTLSSPERAGLAALLFACAAGLLAVSLRWGRVWPRNLAVLPALGWCGLIVSLAIDARSASAADAVVTAPEVTARAADSVNAPLKLSRPLPAGTEVRILGRESWLRLGLADGREAWVKRSAITPVVR